MNLKKCAIFYNKIILFYCKNDTTSSPAGNTEGQLQRVVDVQEDMSSTFQQRTLLAHLSRDCTPEPSNASEVLEKYILWKPENVCIYRVLLFVLKICFEFLHT